MPVGDNWPLDQGPDAELLLSALNGFHPDGQTRVAVAVSGGGDSVALLDLLHRAAPHAGWSVSAVTVDHDLRSGSADEAAGVALMCKSLGIAHATLRWHRVTPAGNLMEQARIARETLIRDWAIAQGIAHVALGHTADDQAETFLMGLGRSSGLDGLAGMRGFWRKDGVSWSRPLLIHTRGALRAYLRRQGISWADDPSNDDDRFTRVRARKAMAALAPLGITVKTLATSITHLALAQHALQDRLHAAIAAHVTETAGALVVSRAGFDGLPLDLQRRLLVAAIVWLSGDPHPPRAAKQTNLLLSVKAGRDATLNGCRFRNQGDAIHILREPKAVSALTTATGDLWDGRWQLQGPHAPGLLVGTLGPKGLPQVKNWRALGIPRDALLVTPAVWHGETLLAAPVAGLENGWKARIVAPFHRLPVSD